MHNPSILSNITLAATVFAMLPATAALAQAEPMSVAAPVAAPAPAPAPAAAPAAKNTQLASTTKDEEIICRRTPETGSLVKTKKACHSRAQWAYIEQENRRMGQDFVLNNQNRPGGN